MWSGELTVASEDQMRIEMLKLFGSWENFISNKEHNDIINEADTFMDVALSRVEMHVMRN